MIENLLDTNGRGILTPELDRIFTVGGCRPMCHVCQKDLEVDKEFRLKPFAVERTVAETKKSLDIMICAVCDTENKKLPYGEFYKAMESLGFKIPETSRTIPDQLEKKWKIFRETPKLDWRHGGLNDFHETPYFTDCERYSKAVADLRENFEQFFENETFEEFCLREKLAHQRWAAAEARKHRGGCFILSSGGQKTIIAK